MMYLAEKVGRFYPQDLRGKYAVTEWLIWQMANQGPKSGECGHFRRLGDKQGDQSYAVRRFTDEVNRLYGVLNNRLYESSYLAGDEYTIADMICYPWTVNWAGAGPGHRGIHILQALAGGTRRAPGRAARHGGRRRPVGGPVEAVARGTGAPRQDHVQPARPSGEAA